MKKRMVESKYNWEYPNKEDIVDLSLDETAFWTAIYNVDAMADYLNSDSKIKKEWWCCSNVHQNNCSVVAEHKDFPVRLFFEFGNSGFADIIRHYTDGASFTNDDLGSWHYSKYDVDYSYDMIKDVLMNYFNKYEK